MSVNSTSSEFDYVFIIGIVQFNFTRSKVAVSATGKMFNCCTIASWSPCLRSRRDYRKRSLKGHSGKKQCLSFAGDKVKMNCDE